MRRASRQFAQIRGRPRAGIQFLSQPLQLGQRGMDGAGIQAVDVLFQFEQIFLQGAQFTGD